MEIASVQECGCVIHEIFAGQYEDTAAFMDRWRESGWKPLTKVKPLYEQFPESPSEAVSEDKKKTRRRRKTKKGALDLSDGEAFDLEKFQRELERRKLSLGEFRAAIRAVGFKAVHLVAQGPFFVIQGEPQGRPVKNGVDVDDSTWLTLVTTRGRRNHMFVNPTVALAMLHGLGVKSVQVDLESWRPNAPTDNERMRPDMAERLRFAHEYAREGAESKVKGS